MIKRDQLRRGYRQARRAFQVLIGLAFLFLTVVGGVLSLAEWRQYLATPSIGLWRFALFSGFTAVLFIFCLYSFLKARSVR